jgi:drug/metabolite transporter (DMT)-like permease
MGDVAPRYNQHLADASVASHGWRHTSDLLALGAVTIWGLNFTALTYQVDHGVPPLALIAVTNLIASLVFALRALWHEGTVRIPARKDRFFLTIAVLGTVLGPIASIIGMKLAGAALIALTFGVAPSIMAGLTQVVGLERLHWARWAVLATALVGVALVLAGAPDGIEGSGLGVLLGVIGATGVAIAAVGVGPLLRQYSVPRINAVVTCMATAPLLVLATPSIAATHWAHLNGVTWAALAFTALGALVAGNVLWYTAIALRGVVRVGIYINLEPFLGAVFGVVLLAESLSGLQVLGGLVIIFALVVSTWLKDAPGQSIVTAMAGDE